MSTSKESKVDIKLVKELMRELEKSSLSKLIYKEKDLEIHLEKGVVAPSHSSPIHVERSVEMPSLEKPTEASGVFITSPMVGTFYSSPAPDQPPFVKVGDRISKGSVVCIVEAMKVMNEVKATEGGVIAEVLFHNGQPVEFGTRLFRIVPA